MYVCVLFSILKKYFLLLLANLFKDKSLIIKVIELHNPLIA